MKLPTLHLNGTSRERLADDYGTARTALRNALAAIEDAAPNARDYYPQGNGAFTQAQAEHASRVARLASVLSELGELQLHVADT